MSMVVDVSEAQHNPRQAAMPVSLPPVASSQPHTQRPAAQPVRCASADEGADDDFNEEDFDDDFDDDFEEDLDDDMKEFEDEIQNAPDVDEEEPDEAFGDEEDF